MDKLREGQLCRARTEAVFGHGQSLHSNEAILGDFMRIQKSSCYKMTLFLVLHTMKELLMFGGAERARARVNEFGNA